MESYFLQDSKNVMWVTSFLLTTAATVFFIALFETFKKIIGNDECYDDNSDDDDFNSSILFVGMDCEMVGVGKNGEESMLARCSLVTLDDTFDLHDKEFTIKKTSLKKIKGIEVLYDVYVRPTKPITDYRTKWSGITKDRLNQNDVITLQECRQKVLEILTSSLTTTSNPTNNDQIVVLVGHALKNDLNVLNIQHPYNLIRDTAYYKPFMKKGQRRYYYSSSAGQRKSTKYYPRKLSDLSKEYLGINIQNNGDETQLGHDSIEDAASSLLLYKKSSLEWEKSLDFPLQKILKERQQLSDSKEKYQIEYKDHQDASSAVVFVGMDCEMVGVGRHGLQSMLARCSIVTLIEVNDQDEKENEEGEETLSENNTNIDMRVMKVTSKSFRKNFKVKVLYDAYVRPTRNITDYRTQYSGITKERLEQDDVISLQECRRNVLELLSSAADGRVVVLVGHALKNDFEVLNIQHPHNLTRDTASYRPYMRQTRKRYYPRKLAELSREQLGIHIQNNGISKSKYNKNGELNEHYQIGHDSIEDAAASLLLYKKVSLEWEKFLKFPLRKMWKQRQQIKDRNRKLHTNGGPTSFVTLYLDGCNIPLGLRQRKDCDNPKFKYQLLAKNKGDRKMIKTPTDWIPLLRSIASSSSHSMRTDEKLCIGKVCIFFDGKMFKNERSRISRPDSFNDLGEGIFLEISDDAVEVDDVLVERCIADRNRDDICKPNRNDREIVKSIDGIIEDFKDGMVENEVECYNTNNSFYVVKRKAGGSKTNKKLFDKLCLRRAEEGAFCLMPSLAEGNPRLQKNSLAIAKQLLQAKVHQIVEYERRSLKDIRSIVITDDVLLSDRVVDEGGVVLRYSQLKQLM